MRWIRAAVTMSVVACAPAVHTSANSRNPHRVSASIVDRRGTPYIGVSGLVRADTSQRGRNTETMSFALYSRVPRSRSAATVHALVVNHRYWGDWVFWTSARLDGRRPLAFSTLDLDVLQCAPRGGCGRDEGFALDVPDSVLRNRRGGFSVRVYSKTQREGLLRVTNAMVGEQLRVVDSVRAVRKK